MIRVKDVGTRLQEIGELKIWAAIEECQGRISAAAEALGVRQSSLQWALEHWASHMAPQAAALREAAGYSPGPGRPGEAQNEVSRELFLETWAARDQKILGVAKELGIDRFAVRRLARLYDAPGAPPPRVRRKNRAE